MSTSYRATWETYVEAWKVSSSENKRELFGRCLAGRCVYTDPLTRAEGWDELVQYMAAFHQQVPGGHFVTEQFIAHHGKSMARWTMRNADGTTIGDGVSYGEYDDDGRLTSMTGFFETPEN